MKTTTFALNTFMLFNFVFAAFLIPLKAQQPSTTGEIYDYGVGDIFHIEEFGWGGGSGMMKNYGILITGKSYSAGHDTLTYTRFISTATSTSENPEWVFDSYYDTVAYDNLGSPVAGGGFDTVYSDSLKYNGRLINYSSIWWSPYRFEDLMYIAGCGGKYRTYENPEAGSSYYYKLRYFKKGNEEWGQQLLVSTGPNYEYTPEPLVYPNPCRNTVTICLTHCPSGKADGCIYSMAGLKVLSFPLSSNQVNRIDVSRLAAGTYYLQINGLHKRYSQLLIRQ